MKQNISQFRGRDGILVHTLQHTKLSSVSSIAGRPLLWMLKSPMSVPDKTKEENPWLYSTCLWVAKELNAEMADL